MHISSRKVPSEVISTRIKSPRTIFERRIFRKIFENQLWRQDKDERRKRKLKRRVNFSTSFAATRTLQLSQMQFLSRKCIHISSSPLPNAERRVRGRSLLVDFCIIFPGRRIKHLITNVRWEGKLLSSDTSTLTHCHTINVAQFFVAFPLSRWRGWKRISNAKWI